MPNFEEDFVCNIDDHQHVLMRDKRYCIWIVWLEYWMDLIQTYILPLQCILLYYTKELFMYKNRVNMLTVIIQCLLENMLVRHHLLASLSTRSWVAHDSFILTSFLNPSQQCD